MSRGSVHTPVAVSRPPTPSNQRDPRPGQSAASRPGLVTVSSDGVVDVDRHGARLQPFPISMNTRHPDHDPLVQGLVAIGSQLGPALLPMLQQPMPQGPENIGLPNCRGVKGINGSMVDVRDVSKQHVNVSAVPLQLEITPTPTPLITSATSQQSPATPVTANARFDGMQTSFHQLTPPRTTTTTKAQSQAAPAVDEFKTEFRFVVNEDAKVARNTVRQHVMREFRRRERWELGRNKVSKAKRPPKKTSEPVVIKEEPVTPPLPQQPTPSRSRPQTEQQAETPLDLNYSTHRRPGLDSEAPAHDRRHSQSMSLSSQSDASDPDRFTSMLTASQGPMSPRSRDHLPFAKYVEQGIIIQAQTVEDAVEEIERSALHHYPYRQDPWAEVARAHINPFSTHVDLGPANASRALLHHYAWVMPSLMDEIVTGTVFHRIGWLYSSVAPHDPTPYHTIIGFTIGHIAMLRGIDEPAMAMEHKEKAFQLINRRIANPAEAASDGNIGAIANIASYELIDCNPDRFAMHMMGLARLVTQRGGMSALGANQALETVLIRLDSIRAYMTISQPRFPTWASLRNLTPLAVKIGPAVGTWFCAPAAHDMHQYLFCEDAIRLIHGLEDVLLLMRSLSPIIPFTPDPAFRTLLIDSLVHHLRQDLFDAPPAFANHPCRRAIRLAAIVLVDIAAAEFFQPSGPNSPSAQAQTSTGFTSQTTSSAPAQTGNLNSDQPERTPGSAQAPKDRKGLGLSRLRERFPSIDRNRHAWGRTVEMVVAVLMQAERVALERPFRAWYVADAVTFAMKVSNDDWQMIENALLGDITARIQEERSAKSLRNQRMPGQSSQDERHHQPAWEMEETVLRFWTAWNA